MAIEDNQIKKRFGLTSNGQPDLAAALGAVPDTGDTQQKGFADAAAAPAANPQEKQGAAPALSVAPSVSAAAGGLTIMGNGSGYQPNQFRLNGDQITKLGIGGDSSGNVRTATNDWSANSANTQINLMKNGLGNVGGTLSVDKQGPAVDVGYSQSRDGQTVTTRLGGMNNAFAQGKTYDEQVAHAATVNEAGQRDLMQMSPRERAAAEVAENANFSSFIRGGAKGDLAGYEARKNAISGGLANSHAQTIANIGLEGHKVQAQSALQGHVVAAKERADAIKSAAVTAADAKVEAANTLAYQHQYDLSRQPARTAEIDSLVKNGMSRDQAVNTVYGLTKVDKQVDASTKRAMMNGLQKEVKLLSDQMLSTTTPKDRSQLTQKIQQKQLQLDGMMGDGDVVERQIGTGDGESQSYTGMPETRFNTAFNNVVSGYGAAGGMRQPAAVTPPKGFSDTGRTAGGKPVYTDGKNYWTP